MLNKHSGPSHPFLEGILLLDKPEGKTSFYLVKVLRRLTHVQKIGHAGTLDPFATGLMVMLIGKNYTTKQHLILNASKQYHTTITLGRETDSYDLTGKTLATSDLVPTQAQVENALMQFQGKTYQIPPMFSAKKKDGKALYELARAGIEVQRDPALVEMHLTLLNYSYPHIELSITCSKGTYVRSLAHDLGLLLGTGAHLSSLRRTACGPYSIDRALILSDLEKPDLNLKQHLIFSI